MTKNKEYNESWKILNRSFENLRGWMTCHEVNNYMRKDDKPGIIFKMILDRYQQNRSLIQCLESESNLDRMKILLTDLDKSLQIAHFFYQVALVQLHEEFRIRAYSMDALLRKIRSDI